MASNFSVLVDVELQAQKSKLQAQLDKLTEGTKVKINTGDIDNLGKATKKASENVDQLAKATEAAGEKTANMLLTYQAANTVFRKTVEVIANMTEQVYELDGAVTEFKKVSDLSGKGLDDYVDKLSKMGDEVARTGSEMVEAATEFKKSGFDEEDAASLALVATKFQNVADGALTAGEASNFIISQLKAFDLQAEESEHVIDALNAVSNNFAVSSSDLSTNMGKASAALAVGNTTYEEALGLMTAGTEVVRNASRVARGLVSVQSRLTQVLDEQSSTGKALIAWYDKYNIALVNQDGQLRSTYDILSDVAKIWNTLSTNEKDYFLLTQAGANQTQNLAAILNNFKTATDATAIAMNSAGSAAQENAKYMESLEAKTNQLKATFQDLSNNVIDNQLIKSILNLANDGLFLLNNRVGQTITQFTLLSGALIGLIGVGKFILPPIFAGLAGPMGIVALLTGATVAVYQFYQAWKDANPTFEESTEIINSSNEALEKNKDRLEEISKIPWQDRSPEILNEKDSLEKENEELKKLKDEYEKLAKEKAIKSASKGGIIESGTEFVSTGGAYEVNAATEAEAWQRLENATGNTREELEKLGYAVEEANKQVHVGAEEYNNYLITGAEKYIKLLESQGYLTDEQLTEYHALNEKLQNRAEIFNQVTQSGEALNNQQTEVVNKSKELNEEFDRTARVTSIMSSGLANNEKEVEALVKKYPELKNGLNDCTLATLELIAKQEIWNNLKLNVDDKIEALSRLVVAYSGAAVAAEQLAWYIKAAESGDYDAIRQLVNDYGTTNYQDIFKKMLGIDGTSTKTSATTSTTTIGSVGSGSKSKSKSTKTPTDESLKSFQSHYKNLQHMREMDEIDAERYYGDLRWLIDEYVKDATAHMKEYGLTTEQINQNMYQYEEEIYKWRENRAKELAEKQKEALEALKRLAQDRADEEINSLEKQKEAEEKYWDNRINSLQKANEEIKEQIALEEKQANLAKARQQQKLVFKDGKFQYISDIDEISKAKTELDAYEREQALKKEVERLETLKKEAINSIDEQIKHWEEYKDEWSSLTDEFQKQQDKLLVEQQFGIKAEGENWDTRLENLKDYVKQYNNILGGMGTGIIGGADEGREPPKDGPGYHFDSNKNPSGGWTQEEMEQGFISTSGGDNGEYRVADDGKTKIKYTGTAIGGGKLAIKQPSMERRPDLKGQTVHVGGHTINYDDRGYATSMRNDAQINRRKRQGSYAGGSFSTASGISLVGENGPELRVLNGGDGIIPADVTKNLWTWGSTNPMKLLSVLSGAIGNNSNTTVTIQNLNLPEVKNGKDFVQYIKDNFWRNTIQFATASR